MKLKKINSKTKVSTTLQLELLKTKIYRSKNNFNFLKTENIQSRFKKALHVIYKYHTQNKRILFIGVPLNMPTTTKQLLKKTKHVFLPNSVWINGLLSNTSSCFYSTLKNKSFKNTKFTQLLLQLKKRVDLIVILNENNNQAPLQESYLNLTPVLTFNSNLESKATYKIFGDFNFAEKNIRNKLLYVLLNSVLKHKIKKHLAQHKKVYKNYKITKRK